MKKSFELASDIIATASLIIKLNVDGHILDTQTNFIAFLNEAGFRTVSGREFTKMNFRKTFERLSPSEIKKVLSEFSAQRDFDLLA